MVRQPMSPLSAVYLAVFMIWVPLLSVRSHRAISAGHPLPSRRQLFLQVVFLQIVFGTLSIYTARVYGIPLFPPFEFRGLPLLAAAAVLVLMSATIPPRWRTLTPEKKRRLMATRPRSMHDMGSWSVISLLAGVSEEITYRGVLFSMLWYFLGSPWAAGVLSAAAFAAGHALQGWRAALLIFFFALAAQGIAWLAGSLYVVMALHFLYDLAAGFLYMKLSANEPAAAAAA